MNAEELRKAADTLKNVLPEGTGFVILTFPISTPGVQKWSYVSNCKRGSMIEGLEAILEKWKNQKVSDN